MSRRESHSYFTRKGRILTNKNEFQNSVIHRLAGPYHSKWDNTLPPVLTVDPGDSIVVECPEACGGQYTQKSTVETVKQIDLEKVHSLAGPIAIRGANPGDTLAVDILEFKHQGWGWTSFEPGFGVLSDEFGDAYGLQIWKVDDEGYASFKPGVRVPIEPFCGVMGVAPAAPGSYLTIPARNIGGNMDSKHLCAGSTVFFPVQMPGALFSLGDGHLAQGDGEVCGTALEAPVNVTVRVSLIKHKPISTVQYITARSSTSKVEDAGYHVTTAAGQDLPGLVHDAVSEMVNLLTMEYDVTRMEAYILCSVAGDLKIAVPVLGPEHAAFVTFHMPRSIFSKSLIKEVSR